MGESSSTGSSELGNVDGPEGELWTDTAIVASVVAVEAGDCCGLSAVSVAASDTERIASFVPSFFSKSTDAVWAGCPGHH